MKKPLIFKLMAHRPRYMRIGEGSVAHEVEVATGTLEEMKRIRNLCSAVQKDMRDNDSLSVSVEGYYPTPYENYYLVLVEDE